MSIFLQHSQSCTGILVSGAFLLGMIMARWIWYLMIQVKFKSDTDLQFKNPLIVLIVIKKLLSGVVS
jgi:hypothetical protein